MTQQNFWESVTKKAAELGGSIGNVASQATKAAAETAVKAGETVAVAALEATAAVADAQVQVDAADGSRDRSLGKYWKNCPHARQSLGCQLRRVDGFGSLSHPQPEILGVWRSLRAARTARAN